ncbi:MAG: PAS domain S-box protein [bacterium]
MYLARGEGARSPGSGKASVWRQALPQTSLLFFLILTVAVAAVGFFFFESYKRNRRETDVSSLRAIADLKVGQIVQWHRVYRDLGETLACNPVICRWLAEGLRNPCNAERRQEILTWAAGLKKLYDFQDILLVDVGGEVVLALDPDRGRLGEFGREHLEEAVRTMHVFISDLHRAPHLSGIHMDLYVPIAEADGKAGSPARVAGVLMFRIAPGRHLFPLLQSWPVASSTAESFLVRKEGDNVLFLSDLRQHPDAALNLKFPLTTPCMPAVLAVLGMEGFIQGVDYRGKPVLAMMQPVPETPWSLVAKIDLDEAMADVRLAGIMLLIACVSLVLLSGAVFVFVWYRKTKELDRTRERAETERRVLTHHYINLSKYANDLILLADENQQVVEANDRALVSYGYTREAILGRRLTDFLPSPLRGTWEAMIRRTEIEHSLVFETQHQRQDASLFPVEVSLRRIGESGLNYYQAIVRDITERRQRQQLFERYQILSQHARDIILFLRPDGRILEANAAAEKAYGYDRDELTAMTVADLRVEHEVSSIGAHLAEADARGITFETVHRRKDGTTFPVEVSSIGVAIGEDRILLSIVRDATERKQAAQALEASAKNLRQVIDLVPHAIYARDKTGRLVLANRRFAELAGVSCEALLAGESGGWMGGVDRADSRQRDDCDVIETGEPRIIPEETWIDSAGVSRVLQTVKVPFTPVGRGGPAVLCVSLDITETKRLQEQLVQSQKMEGIGRLAGGIAHDFNNLLQVIIGFNDILLGRLDPGHPGRKDALEVDRAARRAGSLTRQLLAYSRKQLLTLQVIDLNSLLEKVVAGLNGQLGQEIELIKRLDPLIRPVNVDPGQMEQVLVNLVSLAQNAIPSRGRITLLTKPYELSASDALQMADARAGHYVCLSVSDTGPGMNRVRAQHLFEPSFADEGQGPGINLGLAMVYGIVRQHEGWIQVYSQEGLGTTIKLFLPVADRDAEGGSAVPVDSGDAPACTCRILVVEDEDSVRQFAVRLLKDRGYEVFSAKTGREALAIFAEQRQAIDLLFSDVVLPDINGLDLALQLRREKQGIRLLLTSGYMDEQSRWPAIQREQIRFIQKPYPGRELLSVVQALVTGG